MRLAQEANREKKQKLEYYEIELTKTKDYEYYAKEYEAMKGLIDKME